MIIEIPKYDVKQLSDHFWSFEFSCHCQRQDCDVTLIDTKLIAYLEMKRAEIAVILKKDIPFIIMSGFRCVKHNNDKSVGGAESSRHLVCDAADIWMPGQNMIDLAKYFEDADGLGRYENKNILHIDKRGHYARWTV